MSLFPRVFPKFSKVARSFELLNALEGEVRGAAYLNPAFIAEDFKPESSEYVWSTGPAFQLPFSGTDLGVRLGEIVHNLHSVLDQLVWELVEANGGTPLFTHAFPLCDTEGEWMRRVVRRRRDDDRPSLLKDVDPQAVAFIEWLQPYQAGDKAQSHPLSQLRWLSNTDKHKVLHEVALITPNDPPPIFVGLDARSLEVTYFESRKFLPTVEPGPVQPGTEILRVRVPEELDPKQVNVDRGLLIDVLLSERRYSLGDIRTIHKAIVEILMFVATEVP